MAVQPKPFKVHCPKCGFSKIIAPRSDVLSGLDTLSICPKCSTKLERAALNPLDKLPRIFFT